MPVWLNVYEIIKHVYDPKKSNPVHKRQVNNTACRPFSVHKNSANST